MSTSTDGNTPQGNQSSFFGIKVSKPGINVNSAGDNQLVYKDDYSTKTYYDDTNSRIVEGLLPDGNYGMWVSAPGQDVTTADPSSPSQLVFNSNQQTFKVVQSGQGNFPTASVGNSAFYNNFVTIPHNLGYVPIFNVYMNVQAFIGTSGGGLNFTSTYAPLPLIFSTNSLQVLSPNYTGDLTQFYIYGLADTSNLYIQLSMSTASSGGAGTLSTMPYIYYLVQPTFN